MLKKLAIVSRKLVGRMTGRKEIGVLLCDRKCFCHPSLMNI
jgi:hypothetical protein